MPAAPSSECRRRSRSPKGSSPERSAGQGADGDGVLPVVREKFAALCAEYRLPPSHGFEHASRVLGHAELALEAAEAPLPPCQALAVRLAALLHDADDRKYFPKSGEDFPNAQRLMKEAGVQAQVISDVLRMIGLVSCSKNGNCVPPDLAGEPFWLWPRWADRLEATGEVGVVRCWQFNTEKGEPLSGAGTPRPVSEAEVWALATEERFAEYQSSGGKSVSMMDHYYDKLLRVARPLSSSVRNTYLEAEMGRNAAPLVDMCLDFGRTGAVPEDRIREWAAKI